MNVFDWKPLKTLGGCKPKPAQERFHASYIQVPIGGCWIWMGTLRGSNGYGRIKINGKSVPAHRYSYEINIGLIPSGMIVMHSCDNPLCVNPHHLSIGTTQDNSDDKIKKGRQAKGEKLSIALAKGAVRGEDRKDSKLTNDSVQYIRNSGESTRKLAEKFGVSQCLIYKVKSRKVWKHV